MTTATPKTKAKKIKIALLSSAILLVSAIVFFLYSEYHSKSTFGFSTKSESRDPAEIAKINIDPRLFEFGLYINKISLAIPVVANVDGENKYAYNKALFSGIAHHKDTALPGEKSNIFIFGHSSTWNGEGPYAEAFARLNDLNKDDQAIIYYQNKEYKYKVWKKEVVAADDLSYLDPTKSEQLTLMTCWPLGSNLKRLVVIARIEQ